MPMAEVVLADPGRGNAARFTRLLHEQGFHQDMQDTPPHGDRPPSRERLLHFRRAAPGMPA
jgi:hypothetical protein